MANMAVETLTHMYKLAKGWDMVPEGHAIFVGPLRPVQCLRRGEDSRRGMVQRASTVTPSLGGLAHCVKVTIERVAQPVTVDIATLPCLTSRC